MPGVLLRAALVALLVAGSGMVSDAAIAAPATPVPSASPVASASELDLAALVLLPADVDSTHYLDGNGEFFCLSLKSCADSGFLGSHPTVAIRNSDLQRAYTFSLVKAPVEQMMDGAKWQLLVTATIAEFADAAGAQKAFSATIQSLLPTGKAASGAKSVGDQTAYLRVTGALPDDPTSAGASLLGFRMGRFVVGVLSSSLNGNQSLGLSPLEKLAAKVLKKIQSARTSPSLGTMMVHFLATPPDEYKLLDGAFVRYLGETDNKLANQIDAEKGATTVVESAQILCFLSIPCLSLSGSGSVELGLDIDLYGFAKEKTASAFLKTHASEQQQQAESDGRYSSVSFNPKLVAQSISWIASTESEYEAIAWLRVGSVVARIDLYRFVQQASVTSDQLLSKAKTVLWPGAKLAAEDQVGCIVAGVCPGVKKMPNSVLKG